MSEKRRNELLILAGIGVVALYWLTQQGRKDPIEQAKEDIQEAARQMDIRIQAIFNRLSNIANHDLPLYEVMKDAERQKHLVKLDNLNDEVKNLESELGHLFGQLGQTLPAEGQRFIASIRQRILTLTSKTRLFVQRVQGATGLHTKATTDLRVEQNAMYAGGLPPTRNQRSHNAPGLQFEPTPGEKRAQPETVADDFSANDAGHTETGAKMFLKGVDTPGGTVAPTGFNQTGDQTHTDSVAEVMAIDMDPKNESRKAADSSGAAEKVEKPVPTFPVSAGAPARVQPEAVGPKTPLTSIAEEPAGTVEIGNDPSFDVSKPKPTPTQQIAAAKAQQRQTAENSIDKLTNIAATAHRDNTLEARVLMAMRLRKAFEDIEREAATYDENASSADQKRIMQRVQALIDDFVKPAWIESVYKYDKAVFFNALGHARILGNNPLSTGQIVNMFKDGPKWFGTTTDAFLSVYWVWNGYYNALVTKQAFRPWMKGVKRPDRPERPEGEADPADQGGKRRKPATDD